VHDEDPTRRKKSDSLAAIVSCSPTHILSINCLEESFENNPLRRTEILFCGCGLQFFQTVRDTNCKPKHHILSCHIFSAQYSKRYTYSSHCGPFEAEHSKRNQNRFFKPLKCTKSTPGPLYMGVLACCKMAAALRFRRICEGFS